MKRSRKVRLIVEAAFSGYVGSVGSRKVIAQLMGHAKVDTTLNVYAVVDGSLRKAADVVGSELFTIVHKSEDAAELTH